MPELLQVVAERLQQGSKAFGAELVETLCFLLENAVGDVFELQLELIVQVGYFLFLLFQLFIQVAVFRLQRGFPLPASVQFFHSFVQLHSKQFLFALFLFHQGSGLLFFRLQQVLRVRLLHLDLHVKSRGLARYGKISGNDSGGKSDEQKDHFHSFLLLRFFSVPCRAVVWEVP